MAKTCKYPCCNYPVFGGGYCRSHQWKREDKKLKPIRKRTTKKKVFEPDFGFSSQLQVFKYVYFKLKKPVLCPISGRNITDAMNGPVDQWIKYFLHILPKGRYPLWRLNPRNIMMAHPDVHRIVDQGILTDREQYPDWNWELWDAEFEQAREEYEQFCKTL